MRERIRQNDNTTGEWECWMWVTVMWCAASVPSSARTSAEQAHHIPWQLPTGSGEGGLLPVARHVILGGAVVHKAAVS
jgi:hypothetical protein